MSDAISMVREIQARMEHRGPDVESDALAKVLAVAEAAVEFSAISTALQSLDAEDFDKLDEMLPQYNEAEKTLIAAVAALRGQS